MAREITGRHARPRGLRQSRDPRLSKATRVPILLPNDPRPSELQRDPQTHHAARLATIPCSVTRGQIQQSSRDYQPIKTRDPRETDASRVILLSKTRDPLETDTSRMTPQNLKEKFRKMPN